MKKPGRGRPRGEQTKVITVPVDRIAAVERVLGRSVGDNQTPRICVRVAVKDVKRVQAAIDRG